MLRNVAIETKRRIIMAGMTGLGGLCVDPLLIGISLAKAAEKAERCYSAGSAMIIRVCNIECIETTADYHSNTARVGLQTYIDTSDHPPPVFPGYKTRTN
jgi:hypothetical protein